jgi:hypothetical protein
MISPEGTRHLPGDNQERKTRQAFTETLRRQFRELVKAITGRASATEPKPSRRKRSDETRGGFVMVARRVAFNTRHLFRQFRKLADHLRKPVVRSILDNLYAPRPYDPEQERAYAEHVLWTQIEEWADEQQQDEAFHYARAGGFDHEP